jgi:aryl-alcohol dehydrogenase-like predicted oxidoreductase
MSTRLEPQRLLGATGVPVPLIGYGTAPLGKEKVSREHAVRCLNHAIDSGITYLDTSPDYGSEPHLGAVMQTRRDEVFLATKVNRRSADGARRELEESLQKLQTDHVDLIQVHAVNSWADLEQMLAPDGVLTALEKARDEGLVRFIGVTGHARPEVLGHALDQYPFDTVLVALGMADRLVSSPETFVLPRAVDKDVGVIAMKVFGHGAFDNREPALRYSLGLPGVSLAILGLDNTAHIDEAVRLAAAYRPLNADEQEQFVEEVRPIIEKDAREVSREGQSTLFWLHDTTVLGWARDDEPVLVSY